MELFWKAVGGLLIAAVLGMVLGKDMSLLLCLTACVMGTAVAMHYFQPVLSMLRQLESAANLQGDFLRILCKILGIGLISEVAAMVCTDAGSGAVGKLLRMLTCAGILWVSIPVFQSVLSILQQILGEL